MMKETGESRYAGIVATQGWTLSPQFGNVIELLFAIVPLAHVGRSFDLFLSLSCFGQEPDTRTVALRWGDTGIGVKGAW